MTNQQAFQQQFKKLHRCGHIFIFNSWSVARGFALQNGLFLVMGDDERCWVCSGRAAAWLEKQGYEIL